MFHSAARQSQPIRSVASLKIASEAITGEENNHRSAADLQRLFASAAKQEGEELGTDDLLWQLDQPSFTRRWMQNGKPKEEDVSAFVHWACELGDARNALVHGEDGTSLVYEQDRSPYNGPFVAIGDRILREAIGILLGRCGYPAVWRRREMKRAFFHARRNFGLNGDEPA